MALRVIFCILVTSLLLLPANSQAPTPHFGDIYLEPCGNPEKCTPSEDEVTGALNVFSYDDIRNDKLAFKPVCSDNFNKGNNEVEGSTIICNILGYKNGIIVSSDNQREMEFPIYLEGSYALTDVDCISNSDYNHTHLLRCNYKEPESGHCSSDGALHLTCSGRITNRNNLLPHPAAEGAVHLCPPDQTLDSTQYRYPYVQISMGLVSVYVHSDNQQIYSPINQKQVPGDEFSTEPFGSFEANSVCQQLGFTNAVSERIRTVGSYKGNLNYTFERCFDRQVETILLTTAKANKCSYKSCPCFHHCYDLGEVCERPQEDYTECPKDFCCEENNVVIECTFDISEKRNLPPAGTNKRTSPACTDDGCPQYDRLSELTVQFNGVLAMLVIISVVLAIIVLGIVAYQNREFIKEKWQHFGCKKNYDNI